jgi:uncharacterized cofD-like protein
MKPKNIVTIGGGTGSFMLLSGLKKYPVNIAAIVSMADDGGSTGVLRDELGVLPPGDVRQCLVALSDSSETLRNLLNYRFEKGGLKGHSFGNLLLSALEKISGNFNSAVEEAIKILNVKGLVIPVTNQDARLYMELNDGTVLKGENEINHTFDIEKKGIKKIYFSPRVKVNPKAVKKILEADVIVIGPGNHYCSIIPNLIVKGIPEAIRRSKAKVIYNCNLVNKKGHTECFDLDCYVNYINGIIGKDRIDFVTFNTKKPREKLIARYKNQKELLIKFNDDLRENRKHRIIRADLLSKESVKYSKADSISAIRAFIRHDSEKLSRVITMISEIGEYENIIKEII